MDYLAVIIYYFNLDDRIKSINWDDEGVTVQQTDRYGAVLDVKALASPPSASSPTPAPPTALTISNPTRVQATIRLHFDSCIDRLTTKIYIQL